MLNDRGNPNDQLAVISPSPSGNGTVLTTGIMYVRSEDLDANGLLKSGVPIEPPWSGVAQHTLDDLDASLRQFSDVYTSQPHLRRYCRDQVIAAKARARFASLNESKRPLKSEMVEWMLVWLGDPALFPAWVSIRRERL